MEQFSPGEEKRHSLSFEWCRGVAEEGGLGDRPAVLLHPELGLEVHHAYQYGFVTLWGRVGLLENLLYDMVCRWARLEQVPRVRQRMTVRCLGQRFLLVAMANRYGYTWWSVLSGPDDEVAELELLVVAAE